MTAISLPPLDLMAIESVRRQTRPLAINIEFGNELSELNDDYLRVSSIQGEESVSQPYQFNVELRANDDNPASVAELDSALYFVQDASGATAIGKGRDLIGKWAHLRIALPYDEDRFTHLPLDADPSWEDDTPSRFFAGIITSVTHGTPGVYQLEVQSPLFLLTLRNRYTIYKQKSIEALLTELLSPETLSYNSHFKLQFDFDGSTVTRVQDWLQAGESDFTFMQRVLTKAIIHFYFIHQQDELTLVFSNKTTSLEQVDIPGCNGDPLTLRYSYSTIKALGLQQSDLFCDLQYQVKMVQQAVTTVFTRQQPVWETNLVAQFSSYHDSYDDTENEPNNESLHSLDFHNHHSYTYGADEDETASHLTKVCQQLASEEVTLTGTATSPLLSPGYTFVLSQPAVSDNTTTSLMPAQFDDRTFVVTKITHKVSDNESYVGTVVATEVNRDENTYQDTLITPFEMQNTQQGSILAVVLETEVPTNWRYYDKSSYDPRNSSVTFDGTAEVDKGCLVRFATDETTTHWVSLSPTMQTTPEVGAMVLIARDSNESELPVVQQVLSSHGQKTIQPPEAERRSNAWTANTNWGSSYSTSYSDGISIRFGNKSTVDLAKAINIVESAYDKTGVLSSCYSNSNYNKGSAFSFSVSDDDEKGLSNASVSVGCNFSESHSAQNYNVNYTVCSQGYSKTTKSVNVSYLGTFDDTVDDVTPSFADGKIPVERIITISDALADGSSYNENQITGKSINLSGIGVAPVTSYDSSATVYSNSKTVGKVISINEQTGDVDNTSTTTGNTTSTNTQTGNMTSFSTNDGDINSTSTHNGDTSNEATTTGDTVSVNTQTGDVTNTSTTNGDSKSANYQYGKVTNTSTTTGDIKSTTTQNNFTSTTTTNGFSEIKNTQNGNASHHSETFGNSNIVNTTIGATSNATTTVWANNAVDTYVGLKSHFSFGLSASFSFSLVASGNLAIHNTVGADIVLANKLGVFVNSEVCGGVKAELYTGPVVARSVTQLEADLRVLEAKIIGFKSIL